MNKVEKVREEIEKRYEYWKEKESNSHSIESESRMSECQHLLLLFNSLQEEPVSNDLEEELDKYFSQFKGLEKCYWNWRIDSINIHAQGIYDFAKHFAQWQKERLIDKAVKWLYEHREEVQTEDNGISGWISDELIMGFKKAMKE